MLGLSGRIAAFYAALVFSMALFCAIFFFDDYVDLDPARERRRLRIAQRLVFLSLVHVLFPITALGIVRDLGRFADKPDVNAAARRRLRILGAVGIVVLAVAFVAVAKVANT